MRKWTSALTAWTAASLLVGSADDSLAQQRPGDRSGCDVLADAVYGEIFVSALFGSFRLPPEPGQGVALSCEHTAASVSAGFSRAMAAMDVYVSWNLPAAQSSTVCGAGDIALCTPLARPMVSGEVPDSASVVEMWNIVSGIVSRNMPLGTMSDRSTFHEYELRLRLSDALVNRYWNAHGWSRPRSVF